MPVDAPSIGQCSWSPDYGTIRPLPLTCVDVAMPLVQPTRDPAKDAESLKILLTVDGKGKEEKRKILMDLLARAAALGDRWRTIFDN